MADPTGTQVHGYKGSVSFGGTTLDITEWSGEHKNDVKDGTTSRNRGTRSWVPGIEEFSGSFKCIWDTAQNPYVLNIVPGATGALQLKLNETSGYAMNAIITGVKPNMPVGDLVTYDCSFNSQGSITPPA